MFLNRLELQGFKSFASKTVLEFPQGAGITAIVGPNGSGKSNIIDAIRWLLGERDAKNLRGNRTDDLIFAGTEKKTRMGLAQASIYFDNSTGFFPMDFKEVVVSRRVARDGESKFFLNNSEVRLKEVIDFFAKSKLGARGINIITQGESDAILKAGPQQRREMIEEILGLKEYILKKNSAVRELKNTSFNLEKAKALVEEIKPHLRILRRQVNRYVERESLEKELREIENKYFGSKVRSIILELKNFDPRIEVFDNEISKLKIELKGLEEQVKKIEEFTPQAKKEFEEIRKKRREILNIQFSKKEQKADFDRVNESVKKNGSLVLNRPLAVDCPLTIINEIKILAASALKSDLKEELKEVLKRILDLVDNFNKEARPNKKEPEDEKEKIQKLNDLLDELDEREKVCALEMEDFNKTFSKAVKATELKKDEIDDLEDKRERTLLDKERIKIRREELENHLRSINRDFDEFLNYKGDEEIEESESEKKIYRLRSVLASIGAVDETILKEANETENRYQFLVRQIEDLEKSSIDLKELIKKLDYKVHHDFSVALENINKELQFFVKTMFGGGKAVLKLQTTSCSVVEEQSIANGQSMANEQFINTGQSVAEGQIKEQNNNEEERSGIEIEVSLPKKKVKGVEILSGGERSLLAVAILFSLISISPPPFLVLDEIDAMLDEKNARRFGEMVKDFSKKTQFIIVTHNQTTMEIADILYGVTMAEDGASKIISLKLN